MGLLGSNFVKAMLKKGQHVQVWNRTTARAKAMEAHGAKSVEHVEDVVKGVTRLHMALADDHSVDEILEKASGSFEPGLIIIDHTTTTMAGAIKRTAEWKQRGFTYLHAPVFMGPKNALDSTGHMLVSGDQDVIRKVEKELSEMTGELVNMGEQTGRAAAIKLLGNSFLLFITAGITDTLALAKAMGVSPADAFSFFDKWNPGTAMPARMKKMSEANFDHPSWELKMARKDARLMMTEAEEDDIRLAFIPAIAKEMDHWIDKGHGHKDWTVIAKDVVS